MSRQNIQTQQGNDKMEQRSIPTEPTADTLMKTLNRAILATPPSAAGSDVPFKSLTSNRNNRPSNTSTSRAPNTNRLPNRPANTIASLQPNTNRLPNRPPNTIASLQPNTTRPTIPNGSNVSTNKVNISLPVPLPPAPSAMIANSTASRRSVNQPFTTVSLSRPPVRPNKLIRLSNNMSMKSSATIPKNMTTKLFSNRGSRPNNSRKKSNMPNIGLQNAQNRRPILFPKLEASLRKQTVATVIVHRFPQPKNSFFKKQPVHKLIESIASQSRVLIKTGKGPPKRLGPDAATIIFHMLPKKTVSAFMSRLYNPDIHVASHRTIHPGSDLKIKIVTSDAKLPRKQNSSRTSRV